MILGLFKSNPFYHPTMCRLKFSWSYSQMFIGAKDFLCKRPLGLTPKEKHFSLFGTKGKVIGYRNPS